MSNSFASLNAASQNAKEVAMTLRPAALIVSALLAGCATSDTFSYIQGQRWLKSELNTFDVQVIRVDDQDYIQRGYEPIRIDPGVHQIVVQGPPTAGFRFGEQRTLTLDVKPCTRYWLEAKKANSLSQDFEPRVNYSEPIAGCGAKTAGK
jgi:hypothetical protein